MFCIMNVYEITKAIDFQTAIYEKKFGNRILTKLYWGVKKSCLNSGRTIKYLKCFIKKFSKVDNSNGPSGSRVRVQVRVTVHTHCTLLSRQDLRQFFF